MVKKFKDLSIECQQYINERFAVYGISGEKAFNYDKIFPEYVKELGSEEIIEILRKKHISHVMPKSLYPELESDIGNVYLEDADVNIARGARVMTDDEKDMLEVDLYNDTLGIEGLDEGTDEMSLLAGSVGLFIIGEITYDSLTILSKIKRNELKLLDSPSFFIEKHGGKYLRRVVIGSLAGVPVLGPAVVGYALFKNRKKLNNVLKSVNPFRKKSDWLIVDSIFNESKRVEVLRKLTLCICRRNSGNINNLAYLSKEMYKYFYLLDFPAADVDDSFLFKKKVVRGNPEIRDAFEKQYLQLYKSSIKQIKARPAEEVVQAFYHIINVLIKMYRENPGFFRFYLDNEAFYAAISESERISDIIKDLKNDLGIDRIKENNPFYKKDVASFVLRQMGVDEFSELTPEYLEHRSKVRKEINIYS